MVISAQEKVYIRVNNETIKQVTQFKYLGSVIENNEKLDVEVQEKTRKTDEIFNSIKHTFLGKKVQKNIKVEVVRKIKRYGNKFRTLTDKQTGKINVMKVNFLLEKLREK